MMGGAAWRKVLIWAGLLVAAAVVVAAAYAMFWPVSDLIARHDVGVITGAPRAAALQAARDAARGRLVAFGAGLFAAGALIYTARNFSLARQGQVTDRYTKAIEQLGSDKGLDVRIGGIYALERIARDSARDHPTIIEVLAAFIREHSREPWPPAEPGAEPPNRATRPGPDVLAAATVIARRTVRYDSRTEQLDLEDVNLIGAQISGANLSGVNLGGAILRSADLTSANLSRSHLGEADLTGARLSDANLSSSNFHDANLSGANLFAANLSNAQLRRANLSGANLASANLSGANLGGANLGGAYLASADLTNALWSPDVAVPEGWQSDTDSGRLRRADANSGNPPTGPASAV